MDFGDFYTFHDAGEEDAVHFGVTTRFADTAAWRRLLRGELGSDQRIALSHEEGTRAYDIVSASRTHVRPCSRRFFEVVRLAGFTGITSYALELEAPRELDLPEYLGLAVTGRCGEIDWKRSIVIEKPPLLPHRSKKVGRALQGFYFDSHTWDGTDVFVPHGSSFVIVSSAVKEAIEDAKLTNVRLVKLTEQTMPMVPSVMRARGEPM